MNIFRSLQKFTVQHSPEILVGIGITGMVSAIVMAVSETPKALKIIEEQKPTTIPEKVKLTWKCYIPSAVMTTTSIFCILEGLNTESKRKATMATLYQLASKSYSEYRAKAKDILGEKKEQTIRDEIAKDKIQECPSNEVILTSKGNTLCYDTVSRRYFKSEIEFIHRAVNDLNKQLLKNGYVSANDFYCQLRLPETRLGDHLGWSIEDGLIELDYSSELVTDSNSTLYGVPCLVIGYQLAPHYGYTVPRKLQAVL